MNPLISMMASQVVNGMPQAQMLKQFQNFKQSMSGKDPQRILDDLVRSGRYSQQQIEQARMLAEKYKTILK